MSIAGLIERRAVFAGDQGCVALPSGRDSLAFEPVSVESGLPPSETLDWPMGDRLPGAPTTGIDVRLLEAAVDAAFSNPADLTAAFVVIHRGRLVAEWRRHGDPRAQITVAHLLRMSSGLRFSFPTRESYDGSARPSLAALFWNGVPDHVRIYTGMEDVFRFAIDAPAEHPPGSVGRYRNSDPLVLGAIVRRVLETRGDDYLSWPQRALFDRIGIRRQVLETDVHGNFILTAYDYGAARGWARLELLYLQDGVWKGERLVRLGHVAGGNTAVTSVTRALELVAAAVTRG